MNKFYFYVAYFTITACGQTGQLYLSDEQKISTTKNHVTINKLQNRIKKKQELSKKVIRLLKQEQILDKNSKDFKKIHLERLETEWHIGQIILIQQTEEVNN